MPLRLFFALTLAGLCLSAAATAANPLVVVTGSGPVRGFSAHGVREFRAIPYAASTAGEQRWTPPVPPAPWVAVRDATQFQPGCPQVVRFAVTEASDNEDCLHLNIAIPESAAAQHAALPVLIWMHGGAWVGGSNDLYPLDFLAQHSGVIVVAINYRLGVFGFMPHPAFDAATNGGLAFEDQRLAFRWVQQNIAAFGGNPHNVTIAGESAGAASVCLQLATPERARGLFQRGIIQSAGCTTPLRTVAEGEVMGLQLAQDVGCADPTTALACLRRVPLPPLLAAQTALAARVGRAFSPSVGSLALPRDGTTAFSHGQFVRVPLLNGGTRDEMRLYVGYDVIGGSPVTTDNYLAKLSALYGAQAPAIAARYPPSHYSSPASALGTVMSDYLPGAGLNNCLFLHTATLASRYVPVYQYEFTDQAAPPVMPDPGFELGAVHSSELPYQFPRFTNKRVFDGPELATGSARLAKQMAAYWGAFARSGKPTVAGLPAWHRFRSDAAVLRLDPSHVVEYDAGQAHQCRFWARLYPPARVRSRTWTKGARPVTDKPLAPPPPKPHSPRTALTVLASKPWPIAPPPCRQR